MTTPMTVHRIGSARSSPITPERLARTGRRRGRPVAALTLAAALTVLGGCADDADPGEPDATAAPTASPDPSTTAEPTPEPSASAPTEPPALHVGGAVGDHGVDAPASVVVPYLTDLFGAEPEVVDDATACVTSGLPGRRLAWDGLTVLVRTTDEADAATDPYVAGWVLDEETGESPLGPLTTAEGVGLGDPEDAVAAAYPDARSFDSPDPGMSLWALGAGTTDTHTDDLTVRLTDGVVTAVHGGLGCGD